METNEQLEVIPIINNKDVIITDIICVTCLSRGRRLYNVKDLNVKICCKDLQLSHEDKVCWECKSIMLKFLMFSKKALKAQSLLARWNKDTKNSPLPVLSNLTTLSVHNLTCTEEYEAVIENDIILKSESYLNDDAYLNIDTEIPNNDQYLDENLTISENIEHEEIDIESKITVKTDISNLKEIIQMPDESPPVKQSQIEELCAEVYSNPPDLTPLLPKNEASQSQIMNQDVLPTRTESTSGNMVEMISENSKTAHMKSLDRTNVCLQEAGDYVCGVCNERFGEESLLRLHEKMHLRIYSGNIPLFECKICNKKFHWQTGLHVHMKTHSYKIDKAPYCSECDIQFTYMRNYKYHLKNSLNHVKEQDLKYPCPHCENKYNLNSLLKSHIELMHSNERNYHCNECEQSFKTHRGLRVHVGCVHERLVPLRKYTCTVCGRKFQTTKAFTQHMNSHTGKKPFACETCGATFGLLSSLYNHKTKHKGCRALLKQQKKKPETNCESDVEQTDS